MVACIWGATASRSEADLGDYAAFEALDCPVEVHHYFLQDTAGGLWAKRPSAGSGISVTAWRGVDPGTIAEHVSATAEGKSLPWRGQ